MIGNGAITDFPVRKALIPQRTICCVIIYRSCEEKHIHVQFNPHQMDTYHGYDYC